MRVLGSSEGKTEIFSDIYDRSFKACNLISINKNISILSLVHILRTRHSKAGDGMFFKSSFKRCIIMTKGKYRSKSL